MTTLAKAYRCVAYYLVAGIFAAGSFCLNLYCALRNAWAGPGADPAPIRRGLRALFMLWIRLIVVLRLMRIELPLEESTAGLRGHILLANHPTLVDAIFFLACIPNATCIYKEAIGRNPFYGAIAKAARFIPNVGGPDLIRAACHSLAKGENLIIFPQGTRSDSLSTRLPKAGFTLIAKRSHAPISIFRIRATENFLSRGRSPVRPPPLPAQLEISLVETIPNGSQLPRGRLLSLVEQAIGQKELRQTDRPPANASI